MIIWNIRKIINTFLSTDTNCPERERMWPYQLLGTLLHKLPVNPNSSFGLADYTNVVHSGIFTCSFYLLRLSRCERVWSEVCCLPPQWWYQTVCLSEPFPFLWKTGNEVMCFVPQHGASLRCKGLGMTLTPKTTLLGAPSIIPAPPLC